jgi:hypothetical protein
LNKKLQVYKMNLDSILEILGLHSSDIPRAVNATVTLYNNFGKDPVAELFFTEVGFFLRFGHLAQKTSVESLPSGGIRTQPVRH